MCVGAPQDRMAVVAVRVKNTFIDGFADDEEGGMPLMTQAKTCPAKAFENPALVSALLQGLQAAVPAPAKTPAPPLRQRWADVPDLEDEEGAEELVVRRRSSGVCATWSLAAEAPMASEEMETVIIEPVESRQPRRSRGALLHRAGACRPCAWYWKAQGCQLGHKCLHCHMCPKGEIKARKKNRKADSRAKEEADASD
jgi:hypothetical protein